MRVAAMMIPVRRLLIGGAVLSLAVAVWQWGPLASWKARLQRSNAEAESFKILERAATPSELEEAAGPLGLFLRYPDGAWMAVRYRDSHYYPGWSSAVVRDSGGAWFTSEEHFCGQFKCYRLFKKQGHELPPSLEPIHQLAEAKTLAEARQRLVTLGFREVE
jgi:hypothetical protein